MRNVIVPVTAITLIVVARLTAAKALYDKNPPLLPEFFVMNGIQYLSSENVHPPYPHDNVPDPPYTAGRMKTFYDWSKRAMIEHYLDECVPIFPQMASGDPGFECMFLNVNETSFLITYKATRPKWMPPCCVFGKPFHPPTRNFLESVNKTTLSHTSVVNGKESVWWRVDIEPPTGPFYYAWNLPLRNGKSESQVYATFDFPGIRSWVTQNFFNVTLEQPPAETWKLPVE
eukprot:gene23649-9852_t